MGQRTFWLGAAGVAVGLIALGVIVFVPQVIYPFATGVDLQHLTEPQAKIMLQREQSQTNLRTTLLQFFGAFLVVAGAAATWYQVRVNRDGQITDRYGRAVEYLGNEDVNIRIGGLYVLERIANNSAEDRRFVQLTIGSFLRNRSPWPVGSPDGPQHPTPSVDETLPWLRIRASDVQTALAVLSRQPKAGDAPPISLSRVDLRSAYLENGDLSEAKIRWSNLARARLRGTRLDGSDLHGTDLRQANLQGASLRKASLRNAYLEGADLRGADLEGADLRGAHGDAKTIWPPEYTPEVLRERGAQPPKN
ncbi:pentapeptide repeat-containing protein [Lentzea sp. NPDC051213]|uniref:pentapeptide repeat-containing protein n=1 Tax=Lentzea sp. NPDC051213 TaxID=3364126 RepID=UPI0037B8CF64